MPAHVLRLIVITAFSVHPTHEHKPLSALPIWEDGLSEICYYDATDVIYGKKRSYTRVHMLNRQWMDTATGVKSAPDKAGAAAVFKFNIAEEIPTDNYNYRYLTTVFLRRPDLSPFKVAASSQEWCGTTFKQLRWHNDGLIYRSFSYFGDEGDAEWRLSADIVPLDGLFVIARDVAATGKPRKLRLLASVRSNRAVEPNVLDATLVAAKAMKRETAIGPRVLRRVELDWDGPKTFFAIEDEPPHRLVEFRHGDLRATLQHVERRAYWDTSWGSDFHKPNQAP